MIKDYLDEKLHEECGVFGVYRRDADLDVVGTTYYGLYALQHRGQESCGMAVNDDGVFYKRRELGLVNDVFTKDVLETMPRGNMCIGHCRYATTGVPVRSNAQPFVIRHIKGPMALAHNGNLTNSAELRSEFELSGAIFHSTSDTEVIAYAITRERLSSDSIEQAVEQTMDRLKGAYSLVVMSPRKLIAARDPQGFRPLCIGKLGENDIIASESCAITAAGGEFVRDVEPGEIVVFEHYESCHPGFLRILSDLAVKGSAPLSSRYLVNKEGILVEAGTALAPGAVSRIDPCGKYLIFFSRKGREALADKFGASFVAAVGDVCQTAPFTPEALAALAAQQLNALAQRVHSRLGLTLTAGADVRDYVAAQCSKEKGAEGLADCCERIFRALSEYCLQTDTKLSGTVALTAAPEGLQFALNGAAPADLFSLLPAAYTGAVEQIRAELDALVGLAPVKEYVFGLADNLQVQQRRAAAGFKTASLSMHMIFTGNPGTGKTTIARLVAKYLKAIGALGGGQLVEVTRADLVGRYTGHTAPLTNSVIESALGGVLFIDEAYSLYRGQQDSFGLEAIDTLVKGMEDHRDELVVILAGYTKEMEVFLTANSGLASRFPNKIEFPDYTADELLDITAVLAKGKGYRLAEGCTFPLLGYYKRRQALDSRTAGNGRLARNTLEKAIFNQSRRLIAEPAAPLDLIQPSDLEFEE